jgi:hypothetical protein
MRAVLLMVVMLFAIVQLKIVRWTHKLWWLHVMRLLFRAENEGIITREQRQTLLDAFDPRGDHMVYGRYAEWSFRMMAEQKKGD